MAVFHWVFSTFWCFMMVSILHARNRDGSISLCELFLPSNIWPGSFWFLQKTARSFPNHAVTVDALRENVTNNHPRQADCSKFEWALPLSCQKKRKAPVFQPTFLFVFRVGHRFYRWAAVLGATAPHHKWNSGYHLIALSVLRCLQRLRLLYIFRSHALFSLVCERFPCRWANGLTTTPFLLQFLIPIFPHRESNVLHLSVIQTKCMVLVSVLVFTHCKRMQIAWPCSSHCILKIQLYVLAFNYTAVCPHNLYLLRTT